MPFSFHERLPLGIGPVGRGRAEDAAFEVLGLEHAAFGRRDDGEGRAVIDHQHGGHRRARVLVEELRQRVDVHEPDGIGPGGDARDALHGARAGVDGDVQPRIGVVAIVDGDEIGRRRPLELPVEREFDRGFRGGGMGRERKRGGREQRCALAAQSRKAKTVWHHGFILPFCGPVCNGSTPRIANRPVQGPQRTSRARRDSLSGRGASSSVTARGGRRKSRRRGRRRPFPPFASRRLRQSRRTIRPSTAGETAPTVSTNSITWAAMKEASLASMRRSAPSNTT